jgi:hypothetical protein
LEAQEIDKKKIYINPKFLKVQFDYTLDNNSIIVEQGMNVYIQHIDE